MFPYCLVYVGTRWFHMFLYCFASDFSVWLENWMNSRKKKSYIWRKLEALTNLFISLFADLLCISLFKSISSRLSTTELFGYIKLNLITFLNLPKCLLSTTLVPDFSQFLFMDFLQFIFYLCSEKWTAYVMTLDWP